MPALAVVHDADVLSGVEVTDLLLTITTKSPVRAHWSSQITDESSEISWKAGHQR